MFFTKTRNKRVEIQQFLGRLADQVAMDRARRLEDRRTDRRVPLKVVVWIVPMDGATPVMADAFTALTEDLSSNGLSVISGSSLPKSEVLVCFAGQSEFKYLRANVVNCKNLGLDWFFLGLAATEIVERDEYPQLKQLSC